MKIAWIDKEGPGGIMIYGDEITAKLKERGHQLLLLRFVSPEENENPDAIPIPYSKYIQIQSVNYRLSSPETYPFVEKQLQKFKPDLVHTSLPSALLDYELPKLCKKLKIPSIATFHLAIDVRRTLEAIEGRVAHGFFSPIMRKHSRIIIFSEYQRQALKYLKIPSSKIVVIPNGVDAHKFSPQNRSCENLTITYIGRLASEKNVTKLAQVFLGLGLPDDWILQFAGTGYQEKRLRELARSSRGRITLLGRVEGEDKVHLLRKTGIFVLPSSIEGLSLSLLEAMACGCPCVATDVGADGEVLGGAGILIEPGRILKPQLRSALQLLTNNHEVRKVLGKQARRRIEEKYTLERVVDQLEEVYITQKC